MERGRLEEWSGPMYADKSTMMMFAIRKAQEHGAGRALVVKPDRDSRSLKNTIMNFNGETMNAKEIPTAEPWRVFELLQSPGEFNIVAFDEIQFYPREFYGVVDELLDMGMDVFTAGLETDFRGEPFGPTLLLVGLLKHKEYWHRVFPYCTPCKNRGVREVAMFSQRILQNGEFAPYNDPTIVVAGSGTYEARCRKCFVPPAGKPSFKNKIYQPLPV